MEEKEHQRIMGEIAGSVERLCANVKVNGLRGVIVGGPVGDYYSILIDQLKARGICVFEEGKDEKKYGNGEGWYGISARAIYDWVRFGNDLSNMGVVIKPLTVSSAISNGKRNEESPLCRAVRMCVEDYLNYTDRSREVVLVGRRYGELMRQEFSDAGIKVKWIYQLNGDKLEGKYVVNLEEFMVVYGVDELAVD